METDRKSRERLSKREGLSQRKWVRERGEPESSREGAAADDGATVKREANKLRPRVGEKVTESE